MKTIQTTIATTATLMKVHMHNVRATVSKGSACHELDHTLEMRCLDITPDTEWAT